MFKKSFFHVNVPFCRFAAAVSYADRLLPFLMKMRKEKAPHFDAAPSDRICQPTSLGS